MGLYDTVYFRCPKCEELLNTQSKAGDCNLKDYDSDNVPYEIGKSLIGKEIYCNNCGKFQICKFEMPETMRLGLIK